MPNEELREELNEEEEDFDELKKKLNTGLWVVAGHLPRGLETVVPIIENMLHSLDRRMRLLEKGQQNEKP